MFTEGTDFSDLWRNATIGLPDQEPKAKERYWSTTEILQILVALATVRRAVPWWAFVSRLIVRGWTHAISAAICAFDGAAMLDRIIEQQHGQKRPNSGGVTG